VAIVVDQHENQVQLTAPQGFVNIYTNDRGELVIRVYSTIGHMVQLAGDRQVDSTGLRIVPEPQERS
jgi:hypothetical protein